MTRDEINTKIEELKHKATKLKKEADYYNAMQQALKLVLNGSYGAFAANYFILFNNNVAGTITACGRDLTKTMSSLNEQYWYNTWHLDTELHKKLYIKDISKIVENLSTSVYADTDSVFVSFDPAIKSCQWKNQILKKEILEKVSKPFCLIIPNEQKIEFTNPNFKGYITTEYLTKETVDSFIKEHSIETVILDGFYLKHRATIHLESVVKVIPNFVREIDFIHGIDKYRIAEYFLTNLQKYADEFDVENIEDFELERISESIIQIAKKKYIQDVSFEDGVYYDKQSYFYPKGVELVRSSTPLFARDRIMDIVKYLFRNPETFNIKELLKIVKDLRREFELADIDDISMQSSCSKYEEKVLEDKERLEFVLGAHFAVKCSAYYNFLLNKNKEHQEKYEFIKSGTKIKYYYCEDKTHNEIFAFHRGSYPAEFAPRIDYNEQFAKAILSPINSIIVPLGMPEVSKRLSIVLDIFSGLA